MTSKETFNSLKNDLLNINEALSSVLLNIQQRQDIADIRFEDWLKTCSDIHLQIAEDVVRVAVIGTIKSGKSTFVNSLFRGDYLKRGAGVVTSIVTRIRNGERLKAVLFFKTWDEINSDIEQALLMLPTWKSPSEDKPFDIRREKDRNALRIAVEGLSNDLLITDGTRSSGSVLLTLYLAGYDSVHEMISADSTTFEFSGERFTEHQTFVGDDNLAVYLKDIELVIIDDTIDRSIEIADCQGSDSPNPMHLAMIQEYLVRTHFIIYVISSRTGLRQADIRFLSIIKKMGILENILFVLNTDFSEHESPDDLNKLGSRVREELSLIKQEPELYTFSALFNLLRSQSVSLTKKDSLRLDQWMAEEDFVTLSNRETENFHSALDLKLTQDRTGLLLNNNLARMGLMAAGLERWISMNRELLEKGVGSAAATIKKMKTRQTRMKQLKTLISSTFIGAKENILKNLKTDIDNYFTIHPGSIMEQTSTYVNQYSLPIENYSDKLRSSGFSNTLYLIFQEFKKALDTFMTETINPEITRFAVDMESRMKTSLESVARPYQTMASDEIAELEASLSSASPVIKENEAADQSLLDMNTLKRITGLTLPSSTAALQYSAKVRTEAVMRLGLYSTIKLVKKLFKKPLGDEQEEQLHALKDGFNLIKRETENAIVFHFENYRENFKFQYISRLIDAAASQLHQLLMENFQSYELNLTALENIVHKKGSEREDMINFIERTSINIVSIRENINKCRGVLESQG